MHSSLYIYSKIKSKYNYWIKYLFLQVRTQHLKVLSFLNFNQVFFDHITCQDDKVLIDVRTSLQLMTLYVYIYSESETVQPLYGFKEWCNKYHLKSYFFRVIKLINVSCNKKLLFFTLHKIMSHHIILNWI